MNIQYDVSLKNFSTFKIDAKVKTFYEINNFEDLTILSTIQDYYILGEGSNTVFASNNISKSIIKNNLKGIELIGETNEYMDYEVMSGENFDNFVRFVANQNLWGVENLAFMPGSVGAAPIQNIGAFGIEVKDSILEVKGVMCNIPEQVICFTNSECKFAYRTSKFKEELGNKFFITSVIFRLYKNGVLNLSYASLTKFIADNNLSPVTPEDMVKIVTDIRMKNYPNLQVLGGVGSCFTNVIVDQIKLNELKERFPNIVYFDYINGYFKIATAWLISNNSKYYAGYMYNDNIGLFEKHSLQIVNYGNASPSDFIDFTNDIKQEIFNIYGLNIELEPNIVI